MITFIMVSETSPNNYPPARWIFVFLLFLGVGGSSAQAADFVAMNSFVDRVAAAVENRIQENDLGQSMELLIETGSGVDPVLAKRFFGQQLKDALELRGYVFSSTVRTLKLELVVSIVGERVWANGALVDLQSDKHIQIALETRRHPALEAALGVRRNYIGRRTWEAKRVGQLAPDVLGMGIFPMENAPQGTVAVTVHADGVRLYQLLPGGISEIEQPFLFKEVPTWPRVRKAWLGSQGIGRMGIVTTSGDSWLLDTTNGEWKKRKNPRVPLQQIGSLGESFVVTARLQDGSVNLTAPYKNGDGTLITSIPKTESVRSMSRISNTESWIWVDGQGQLKRSHPIGNIDVLSERVGDQLAVADLNGSGRLEVVTTSATSIGEADELLVRSLSGDGKRLNVVVYRSSFKGSIVGLTIGFSDYLDLPTVWFVERRQDNTAHLWKLEAGR